MTITNYDVIVIGSGSGGRAVAGRLADEGMRVAMVEQELVGGECPYWACMPAKALLRATDAVAGARRVPGVSAAITDVDEVIRFREDVVSARDDARKAARYAERGVTILRGRARLRGPGHVDVDDHSCEAARIVVASGSVPVIPPIEGLDGIDYWTNREAMETCRPPSSALLVGGGPVGLEIGQAFSRLGTRVTIVEPQERLLAHEAPEVGELLAQSFRAERIEVMLGAEVVATQSEGMLTRVRVEGGEERLVERVVLASGRRANVDDLGLESVGITPAASGIVVDERCRAGQGIWAVGDVTGIGQFTHLAAYQARIACADILGQSARADYSAVPRSVFCDPEVAAVGLTVAGARDSGIEPVTATVALADFERAHTYGRGIVGIVGVVADQRLGLLVGAYAVGPLAAEWMGMASLAVRARVPLEVLRDLIVQFPTFSETLVTAVRKLDIQ